ncbi:hypothetical protein, partial [Ferruginibacter sp.]|uniref:hypothetical protein n=1 Tax=Ferruginibacter sp. TaxID=1940288 RepID=UPI002659C0D0
MQVEAVRKPKMCPVHREITDISLQSGDPQAGFSSMSPHLFGEQSCRGSYDGRCNFKPEMTTQSYWDSKAEQADQRRQEREQQQELTLQTLDFQDPATQEDFIDEVSNELSTDPSLESQDWGVAETMDNQLEAAPAMAMAAKVRKSARVPVSIVHGGMFEGLNMIEGKKPGLMVNGMPLGDFHNHWGQRQASGEDTLQWPDIEVSHPHPRMEQLAAQVLAAGSSRPVLDFLAANRARRLQQQGVQARTAEALETVDVTKGTDSPEPKMDKSKWTPDSVSFLDVEMAGSPHPTIHQDIAQPAQYKDGEDD